MPAHFKTPLVPTTATAIHPSFQANLDNPHEFGDLMDESAKLRARIAERPAKRERLEALLLHVCIRQAEHVSELQDRRDDLIYLEKKDPVYGAEGMTQNNQRIESEATTLAKLVRVYRLFIHVCDPADFAAPLKKSTPSVRSPEASTAVSDPPASSAKEPQGGTSRLKVSPLETCQGSARMVRVFVEWE
jgi:hypothetical protein